MQMRVGIVFVVLALAGSTSLVGAQSGSAVDQLARERVVSLSVHIEDVDRRIEQRLKAHEKADAAAFASSFTSLRAHDDAQEKHLDLLASDIARMRDETRAFMPRAEYELRHKELAKSIDELQARIDKMQGAGEGVASTFNVIGYIIGALGTICSVAFGAYVFFHQRSLNKGGKSS